MLVVMPDAGTFGWYADHYNNGPRWESYHVGELIPWVDATLRTKPERAERAIAGLSMGGHGTAAYAGRHPDLFAAAAPFSGVVNPIAARPGRERLRPEGDPARALAGPRRHVPGAELPHARAHGAAHGQRDAG